MDKPVFRWPSKPQLMAWLLALVMSVSSFSAVLAQTPSSLPQNLMPGNTGEYDTPTLQAPPKQLSPDTATPPPIQLAPQSGQEESISIPSFKLEEIQIRDATVLTREDLAPLISPLLGQEVTEAQLLNVTRKITDIYKAKGYLTSRAFLPSQKISNGIVVILAQENRVGEFRVTGNKHVSEEFVLREIMAKPGEVYNIRQLEKDLNRLKLHPKIAQVRANIQPGVQPGTSDTILEIVDQLPRHLYVSMDNTGRETIGVLRYSTTYVDNDLFGIGHQLALNYTGASGLHSWLGQYAIPLNDWGWTVGVRASTGTTLYGGAFDFLDLRGESDNGTVYTTFPIFKKERYSLSGDLAFNVKTANTWIGTQRIDTLEQNVQSLTAGLKFLQFDKLGRTYLEHKTDWGVGPDALFVRFSGAANRTFSLPLGMTLLLRSEGQYAVDNLPGTEQFQVGGFSTVRGYPEGFLIGDSGFVLGSELHMPLWGTSQYVKDKLSWLLFWEGGNVYLSELDDPDTRGNAGNIRSFGIGLRGKISRYLTGRLDFGFANTMDADEPTARVHFGITGNPF